MKTDEQAIRDLVVTWLDATKSGDVATVLSLMADDVVFMVPGQEPFGKEAFAASAAKCNRLKVTITQPKGNPVRRSGYTLTILRASAEYSFLNQNPPR